MARPADDGEAVPHHFIGDNNDGDSPVNFDAQAVARMLRTPERQVPPLVSAPSPFWEAFGGITPSEMSLSARLQNPRQEQRDLSGLSPGALRNEGVPSVNGDRLHHRCPLDPGLSLESHRLLAQAKSAVEFSEQASVHQVDELDREESYSATRFTRILLLSACISSALSFAIDFFSAHMGSVRMWMLAQGRHGWMLTSVFNVLAVVIARLLIRKNACPQAEGSGMPEVKTMLFGQVHEVKQWLTPKVLIIKTAALALCVGAGLPIGKEGPFVHLASCITAILEPMLLDRASRTAFPLLLASVAVGVGTTFSSPLGGVLFALELMLPQIYDKQTYISCFQASVIGSVIYCCLRTWMAGGMAGGSTGLLPLMSTDVLPGQGVPYNCLGLNLLIHVLLGALCGLGGGFFIKTHRLTFFSLKAWRNRGKGLPCCPAVPPPKAADNVKLSGGMGEIFEGQAGGGGSWATEDSKKKARASQTTRLSSWCSCCSSWLAGWEWRDVFQMAAVALINSRVTAMLPLLRGMTGEPPTQPALLSMLFSKGMDQNGDTWDLGCGKFAMSLACLAFKWFISAAALALPAPGGIVAPTMILGGFTARVFAYLLIPEWLVDYMLDRGDGVPITADDRGAFYARLSICGAAAFCSAVARAFAMAITVFEVLALPNSVIPLSMASLTAIFVANRINVSFFDQILINKEMLGVAAMTEKSGQNVPAYKVMRRYNGDLDRKCLPTKACLGDVQQLLHDTKALAGVRIEEEFFPIVQHCRGMSEPLLVATISRKNMEEVLRNCRGAPRDTMVDFLDLADYQKDPRVQLINRTPLHVESSAAVQHVFLMMKVMAPYTDPLVFVTCQGRLLGVITDVELLARKK